MLNCLCAMMLTQIQYLEWVTLVHKFVASVMSGMAPCVAVSPHAGSRVCRWRTKNYLTNCSFGISSVLLTFFFLMAKLFLTLYCWTSRLHSGFRIPCSFFRQSPISINYFFSFSILPCCSCKDGWDYCKCNIVSLYCSFQWLSSSLNYTFIH
jgi:hypothetical protein